jgi:hypothetical protein
MTMIVGEGRVLTVIRCRINQAQATRIADAHRPALFAAAINDDGAIDLWFHRSVTALEEYQVMDAYMRVTDARLRCHGVTR